MIKHLQLLTVSFPLLLILSCSIVIIDASKVMNDIKTNGFIDRHHFQVIIQAYPDASSRSLEEQRTTALQNAKKLVNKKVLNELSNYYFISNISTINALGITSIEDKNNLKAGLKNILQKYLRYGYPAYTYYQKDYSAVLVYRIYRANLLSEIESIKIEKILKDLKDTKKGTT